MTRDSTDRLSTSRAYALLALLLLVPAPSIGTALAMWVQTTQGTWVGQGAYLLSKLWLVALPLAWLLWVDGGRVSWSPTRKGRGSGSSSGARTRRNRTPRSGPEKRT